MIPRTEWEARIHEVIAELASGATAVSLYGAGHPRAAHATSQLVARFQFLFDEEAEITFVVLGEELFVQGRPFTRTSRQAPALLRRFRRRSAEHVTFSRGMTAQELAAFLADLAAVDESSIRSHPHIGVGKVEVSGEELGGPDTDRGGSGRKSLPAIRDRVAVIHEVFERFAAGNELAVGELEGLARAFLGLLAQDPNPLHHLAPWSGEELWLAVHGHNAGVLAAGLAVAVRLAPGTCAELALAGILHDVGWIRLPADTLGRSLEHTGGELELILDHPKLGFEALLGARQLPAIVPIVAFEHHLNFNATGYPRLQRPRRPHTASRLVQVVDSYDVLATARGGRGLSTAEGTRMWLDEHDGNRLDPDWLAVLRHMLQGPPQLTVRAMEVPGQLPGK